MAAVTAPPRTLKDIEDLAAGAVFPGQALSDCETALCLFSALWHGKQDAYWVAQRGLAATCVDLDGERLSEMAAIYPPTWRYVQEDVYDFAILPDTFDAVTADPYAGQFDRMVWALGAVTEAARKVVIVGMDDRELDVPHGWQETNTVHRSDFHGGVYWRVLEPTGQGINPDKVSACLVTRGDQPDMMARIHDSLLSYDEVIVWDNSQRIDMLTAGRFAAMQHARNEVCYVQDDDVIVPPDTQRKLLAAYEPGMTTANYGHGHNDGGYGDLPLVCGGGLMHKSQMTDALKRYANEFEVGRDEWAYADFIVGVLTPFRHIHAPFHIELPVAQHSSRLVNQPWAAHAKQMVTERARSIRDEG